MSVNQSRGDKNEPPQYRRSGRSANPASSRNFSGGGGAKGGGGSTTAPPSSAFHSGKSFKKVVSNVPGAQARVTGPNPNVNFGSSKISTGGRAPQNGAHIQPPFPGTPDASTTGAIAKPTDASVHKSTPGLPKAPQSNAIPPSSGTTDATGPSIPVKGSADASRAFPLQFGSISPGVMNGMQVPARTNSAPPNFDEQKQAEPRLDHLKETSFRNPAVPKQHLPRKDPEPIDKPNTTEAPRPTSKDKKEIHSSTSPVAVHAQKPTGPPMSSIPGVSMQMPFHQSQIHIPFGGPNPPLPTQSMANTSLPVPLQMHIPVGNSPQVSPQVFVPGIQHHQGIIHQSQGLTFSSQMNPQLGNMGMGMGLGQYHQQPVINFGGARRAVKITHPDTHEELRLDKSSEGYLNDGSSGQRSQPHGPPQSQVVPSFPPAHPMNYSPNSYNASPLLFQTPGANLWTNAQSTSSLQVPRFYNQQPSKQVTVKPALSSPAGKVVDSSPATDKSKIPKNQRAGEEGTSGQTHKDSETIVERPFPESDDLNHTSVSSVAVEGSTSLMKSAAEVEEKAMVNKSGSFKEEQKHSGKKDQSVTVDKIGGQSSSVSTSLVGLHGSIDTGVLVTSKISTLFLESSKDVSDASKNVAPSDVAVVTASKCDNDESLSSTEVIGSRTNSDKTLEAEESIPEFMGSKEQVKESVAQNQDSTVLAVTVAQQEPVTISTTDLDVRSARTSLNLDSSHDDNISSLDDRLNKSDGRVVDQGYSTESVLVSVPETSSSNLEIEAMGSISPFSGKARGSTAKGKKKIKEILKNADARGTTSDLYNAYKRPEEKKETSSVVIVETPSVNISEKDVSSDERHGPSKIEPEDWEDAAEISAPKMVTSLKHHGSDDNDGMTKKYSRDFLLKFLDQYTDLPEGFEITSDITEVLIVSSFNNPREPYPSPGRGGDRSTGGSRLDRRPSNVGLDDKWNKGPGSGPMGPGWDLRVDMGYPARGTHGVLRTPRVQSPGQYTGGILSGPMQSPGPQSGPMQRNNSDSDRWQRATGFQKGLIPSPHTPMMHKAEKKYEVGKITDEEQAKQRRLKGILNKLTPQNFEKLFDQVKEVNIDNAGTLSDVIDQIFDKALMEPTFVEMYANFCSRLSVELPDFSEDNEKITFKRLLLNKCQEEFERGEREEEEANRTEEEGELKQTEEEREEKRIKARRRMLGNIRLIGELYKKKMLTERIMHECIKKLLGQYQNPNPDEENIEALCKLMSTIGEMIDHPKAKEHMDAYFDMMFSLSNNMKLSSRVRFMLKDAIDLRRNKWQQRRKVEGPKKIEEVHRDAAQERQSQSNRLARGPNSNSSLRRGQPMDFGQKGSNVLPLNPQMSGFRGLPHQGRGYGNPDPRFDSFENRTLSVPLRPMGDDVTLGPQGGLARGMSVRGQPSMQGMPLHGPNGYGSVPDRSGYGPRDNLGSRYVPERFSPHPAYDLSNIQEPNMNYVNRDMRNAGRVLDRAWPSALPEGARVSTPPQSGPSDKVLSEDLLHDKSIQAIKEFYSARDEKEVALCIKELNAPSFYPSMISIWVTDSFERKEMDRDSLAKLLINLTKSRDQILSQDSLVQGFESVLSTLEDAVNDAPKAAEFLGRLFARILLENVIPYKEVLRLIYEGGEEQGQLVEIGLAAEVLGVVLEIIKTEKGDPFLNDLLVGSNSNIPLENFRPATVKKTLRLDKFI